MPNSKGAAGVFYITYRNQGYPERVPERTGTREEAKSLAEFLKFQGATAVRVHWIESPTVGEQGE